MPSRKTLANAIRFLSIDAVQRAKSGHPGAPLVILKWVIPLAWTPPPVRWGRIWSSNHATGNSCRISRGATLKNRRDDVQR